MLRPCLCVAEMEQPCPPNSVSMLRLLGIRRLFVFNSILVYQPSSLGDSCIGICGGANGPSDMIWHNIVFVALPRWIPNIHGSVGESMEIQGHGWTITPVLWIDLAPEYDHSVFRPGLSLGASCLHSPILLPQNLLPQNLLLALSTSLCSISLVSLC